MYNVGGISNERESLIWANHQISLTNEHAKFIDNIDMKYHTEIWYIRQKKSQIVCYDLKDQFHILSNEKKNLHDASLITNLQCKIQIYAKKKHFIVPLITLHWHHGSVIAMQITNNLTVCSTACLLSCCGCCVWQQGSNFFETTIDVC